LTKDLYLFSGLGADRRVFEFLDLSSFKIHYINWIKPEKKETIKSYSQRLLPQITARNPILMGVSFGGIVAIEIGKLISTDKIFLVSSVKTRFEIPLVYRMIGNLWFDKLIPAFLFKRVSLPTYWFFGVTSNFEKTLLKNVIKETDPLFLKWAIRQIISWKNKVALENVYHVHGNADRILPPRNANKIIPGGGHFMIVNKAKEISESLERHDLLTP
jgi:hypothetical protein